MHEREKIIRQWFDTWLNAQDTGITELFTDDAVYIESWGPEYHGSAAIKRWFEEWNVRAQVNEWTIKQFFHKADQTIVEWFFSCSYDNGRQEAFDGISLIKWSPGNLIYFLQEFGCKIDRYDPYANID